MQSKLDTFTKGAAVALVLILAAAGQAAAQGAAEPTILLSPDSMWKQKHNLRVCADPQNLPFSNREREGFDNKIADVIAHELGDSVSYAWWPSRRGYVRNTLSAGTCDLVIGVPAGFDLVATSKPYYRSTYYIVTRTDRKLDITSLDDPRLKTLIVGVNLIGEDYTNTPPAHALTARGVVGNNVRGFTGFIDAEHPPGEIIDSLAKGKIDVALVWGPIAGYFAKMSGVPMTLTPLPDFDSPDLPFAYGVTIGTRRSDRELRTLVDDILVRKKPEIDKILMEYNVPTVGTTR
ncbi:MAG: substrate-binding domain-containing protein [Gemmatimonadaceae bacterium]|nr:substrate-binding domain-containing protein [Gemmatimonadaceae bacterium]